MELIEASGLVKNNKEPLKMVTRALETDNECDLTLSLTMSRQSYLRLVRGQEPRADHYRQDRHTPGGTGPERPGVHGTVPCEWYWLRWQRGGGSNCPCSHIRT